MLDWSQLNCPGLGSKVREALGQLTSENMMAGSWVVLYQSRILMKLMLERSDPAAQVLNHSEPRLRLLKAIENLGILKSLVWGLLFFS